MRIKTLLTSALFEKLDNSRKNIYFCFINYAKAFDRVDHNTLKNSSRDGNTRPPYLLLRNLYAAQEARVRTRHGMMDWFQTGKGVCQACILSPCLFNFCSEYIMENIGLNKTQAGIKITRRNINNIIILFFILKFMYRNRMFLKV